MITEPEVETRIETQLRNLKWDVDKFEYIRKREPHTKEEKAKLKGKFPDYILYDKQKNPIGIIEAKRPGKNLNEALDQGIGYARALDAPLVFATDGVFTKTYHTKFNKPLYLNKEEVDELLRQSVILEYIHSYEYNTEDERVIESKEKLISIFKDLNNQFKEAGVRAGMPRIELFCNFLFLKLISELAYQEDSIITEIPEYVLWKNFKSKSGLELYNFINKDAYEYFKGAYGGEVLSPIKVNSGKYNILNKIIDKLDQLTLSSINTDIKGDAFEFFLRNYGGAETDFGEYFTPRHIVKSLVKILDPKFGEKVYDPFCGTGGMLTYSYKHIYDSMARNKSSINLLKKETIYGGELTEMSRVAKMNMILAGDGHSNILQQDSYEHPQNGKYDVVVTNIPFGRKMRTEYGVKYGFNTTSAEVTGVLHCLNALSDSENARAGIIVPEGILFDGNKNYTKLRELITEKYSLETIVSLPSGVFGKNTGVKSNMLIVKKHPQKNLNHIWYFNLKNDGYTLDAHRRKLEGVNDFDILSSERNLHSEDIDRLTKLGFSILEKEEIRRNKYQWLPKYNIENSFSKEWEEVKLEEISNFESGFRPSGGVSRYKEGAISLGGEQIHINGSLDLTKIPYVPMEFYLNANRGFVKNTDILMCKDGALTGKTAYVENLSTKEVMINEHVYIIRGNPNKVVQKYLFYYLYSNPVFQYIQKISQKSAQPGLNQTELKNITIPLPPLEIQQKLVEELDSFEKVIKGARQIVDNWKPNFPIEANWKIEKIKDIISQSPQYGISKEMNELKGFPILRMGNLQNGTIDTKSIKYVELTEEEFSKFSLTKGDILFNRTNSIEWVGKTSLFNLDESYCFASYLIRLKIDPEKALPSFINYSMNSIEFQKNIKLQAKQSVHQANINAQILIDQDIFLPSLKEQKKIVQEIENQEKIIEANKSLIEIMENNIKQRLSSLY